MAGTSGAAGPFLGSADAFREPEQKAECVHRTCMPALSGTEIMALGFIDPSGALGDDTEPDQGIDLTCVGRAGIAPFGFFRSPTPLKQDSQKIASMLVKADGTAKPFFRFLVISFVQSPCRLQLNLSVFACCRCSG
ncbi:hypothetical protein [Nonomuraea sp. NPDC049400]|uniref:hypothetical protein n=1 Tax=Nonomuraea sp. NPDC049400 TaxID=3364352 RepID=UPI0037925525